MYTLILALSISLPNSSDGKLQELAEKMIEYNHVQCFQNMTAPHNTVYSVDWLPGPDRVNGFGKRSNSHEFPWEKTAGFEQKPHHYYFFPANSFIEYTDTTFERKPDHGNVERVIEWKYPVGTVFVETLSLNNRVFEVRTRTKGKNGWINTRYAPWQNKEDFILKLSKLNRLDAGLLVDKLKISREEKVDDVDDPHDVKSFKFSGYKENLPSINKELVDKILGWDFESYSGWTDKVNFPSSVKDELLPKDYKGYIVGSDTKSCNQCHNSTLKHVFPLENGRDWYGRIRGSDGIFSFHIFDDDSITTDGQNNEKDVKFNKKLPLKKVNK